VLTLSADAATLTATDDDKEDFYDSLNTIIRSVPFKHRLFLLGLNADVGRDRFLWPKVMLRPSCRLPTASRGNGYGNDLQIWRPTVK